MLFPKKPLGLILLCCILSNSILACAPRPTPGPDVHAAETALFEGALLTATFGVPSPTVTPSPTYTPSPTFTVTPSATPIRTPPVLAGVFQTDLLNPKDKPQSYVQGACSYLRAKWDPNNAAPGTVVMPIMFHSITDGEINHPYQITAEAVTQLLRDIKSQGFEAISMQQLADFLQHNAKIPARSVLLIVDDLHTDSYYRDHFVPIFKEYGWSLANAWISSPEESKRVRDGNIQLQKEGWVDHQAHGVLHNINITEFSPNTYIDTPLYGNITAEEFTKREIEGSMKAITETFGKAPIAYIWPGGNFSQLGTKIARQAGFQLGFTINPRGPLMFNWIPQGSELDPGRPSFLPEGYVKDPLMLLPRYWDIDARYHLDTIRQIGKQAAAYAEKNRADELAYYDIVCQSQTGPLPPVIP
jgi:hypothetical protein